MVSNAALCPENHRLCVTPVIQIHVFTDTFIPGSAGGDTINSSQRPVSLSEEYVCRTSPPLNWGKVGEKGVHMASAILCGLGYSSKTQSRQFPQGPLQPGVYIIQNSTPIQMVTLSSNPQISVICLNAGVEYLSPSWVQFIATHLIP